MAVTNKLKPCPFCGGTAYRGIESMSLYWSIGCTKCSCDFPRKFKNKTEATKFWNNRYV